LVTQHPEFANEGYFYVCLGCHNLHLHYKRLSNLPFLVSREYKITLFYSKCEIKNKQPFENMWSKYIKEHFYLYVAYYLMKISKVPFQLERVVNDDWGNTFPVRANA
jgi:hypothetical protein